MKSIAKRRAWGAGHRISIRLDRIAREALYDIAGRKSCTVGDLLSEIDRKRRLEFRRRHPSYVVACYPAMMQAALRGDAKSVA
jgi:predicted DNA-binding ribbon-helix-helix protein